MTYKPGLWRRWGSYRPAKSMLFWACVACTIATMVIGFNWGWMGNRRDRSEIGSTRPHQSGGGTLRG